MSHPHWLRQPTWVIDPVSGDDRNSGLDDAHAIKHAEELYRRWGPRAYFKNNVDVTVRSSLNAGDILRMDNIIGPGVLFNITGTKSTAGLPSGTLTAFTAQNRTVGAQSMPIIADTSLGAGGFSAAIGKLVKITGGARVGTGFFAIKDTGTKTARITIPVTVDFVAFPTRQTPIVGDPYQVYNLPTVVNGGIQFESADPTGLATTKFEALNLISSDGFASFKTYGQPFHLFVDCTGSDLFITSDYLLVTNCYFGGTTSAGTFMNCGYIEFRAGGASRGYFAESSYLVFDFDYVTQGSPHGSSINGSRIIMGNCAHFDNSTLQSGCMSINQASSAFIGPYNEVDGLLWGDNNSTSGPAVRLDGSAQYDTVPQINKGKGLGREVRIGGQEFTWADVALTSSIVVNGASLTTDTFF